MIANPPIIRPHSGCNWMFGRHRLSFALRRVNLLIGMVFALVETALAQLTATQLEIIPPDGNRWIRLNAVSQANSLLTLEASPNLRDWSWFATLYNGAFAYPDADSPNFDQRFYRGFMRPRTAADDWKNQLVLPNDVFASSGAFE
jgi:hypothetical protein